MIICHLHSTLKNVPISLHHNNNHHPLLTMKEDTNSNKLEISQPPSYAADTRSHLPTFHPITEYFQFPTLTDPCSEEREELDPSVITPQQAELLRWHYRLDHLSFKILRLLANLRIIPYQLRDVYPLKCASCMYGAMTKKN